MVFWSCFIIKADGTEIPLGDWRGETPLEAAKATKKGNSHDSSIASITVQGTGENAGVEESYPFDEL